MDFFLFLLFLICVPGLVGAGAIWEFGDAIITILLVIILLFAVIIKFSNKE